MAALKYTAAAGGGTVTFPAGVFVISTGGAGLAVPSGVVLQGARTDLTALKLGTNGTSLPPAEIARSAPERPGRWGLADLTIYQMYVYRVLIYVGRLDDGFTMVRLNINSSITNSIMQWPCGQERVRIRANAFHCGQTCGPAGSEGGDNPVLSIHGRNWRVVGCDILSTWSAFSTGIYDVLGGSSLGTFGLKCKTRTLVSAHACR